MAAWHSAGSPPASAAAERSSCRVVLDWNGGNGDLQAVDDSGMVAEISLLEILGLCSATAELKMDGET